MTINKEFAVYHRRLFRDFDRFMSALRRPQRKAIRVNTLKASKDEIEGFLESRGVAFSRLPWYDDALWIDSDFELDTVEHQLGYYYVQSPSSMVPPLVLDPKPDESVLDLCAAPGSKTTQLAQLMRNGGVVVANEASFVRVRALVINIQRCGVSNAVVTRQDGCVFHKFGERFDRVLVDAPCSDVGTAGRNPQVLSQWSLERVRRLANFQRKLVSSAYSCLKPGGVLVYSTCTTSREENEDVVEHLIKENADAVLDEVRLPGLKVRSGLSPETRGCARILPQDNGLEAYFVARVCKNA